MTKNVDFSRYCSIKCGPTLPVHIIQSANDVLTDAYFIGGGNNLLLNNPSKPLQMLSKRFDYITFTDGVLHIGAATPSGKIFSFCKKNNLGGFEFLAALPGQLGGLLSMNAGMGEMAIFDSLLRVQTHNSVVQKEQIPHGYRYSSIDGVIFEASFKPQRSFDPGLVKKLRQKRKNQPSGPSAGSCFKNPPGDYAGRLLEGAGMKGKSIGGFAFSDRHANFLINRDSGTAAHAVALIALAQKSVQERFETVLELEIRLLD
ncbi:MAG: UDP-N-acetylmuramate dehydrogenase [Campylobacterota bacterium]